MTMSMSIYYNLYVQGNRNIANRQLNADNEINFKNPQSTIVYKQVSIQQLTEGTIKEGFSSANKSICYTGIIKTHKTFCYPMDLHLYYIVNNLITL